MADYIQDIVNQIKDFINIEFGFCDGTGIILGCSDESKVGIIDENISAVLEWDEDVCPINDYVYQKYYGDKSVDFIVFIKNPNQEAINYIHAISICIMNLKNLKENYSNRANFVRSILLGEIPEQDIYNKVKDLQFTQNGERAIFLIRAQKVVKYSILEIIQSIFPNKNKDLVVVLDELNIVLVKEMKPEESGDLEKIASSIIDTLNSEAMIKAYVGIGTVFNNISEILRSFKEAQTALTIGEIFYGSQYIINFNKLGLGRLIYQLPRELCNQFLNEVLEHIDENLLDEEILLTINKLFENNLHVSETARQLYLHRNTLIYRLEKIQKTTGLDLKRFDDAIVFKIALLIREYLKKSQSEI